MNDFYEGIEINRLFLLGGRRMKRICAGDPLPDSSRRAGGREINTPASIEERSVSNGSNRKRRELGHRHCQ